MATHTSSFSSNGYVGSMYKDNGNETQEYELNNPLTLTSDYTITKVEAHFYNFFRRAAGNANVVPLTLRLDSTTLKTFEVNIPAPEDDYGDFSFTVTSFSASTIAELQTTINHIDIRNDSSDYAIRQSSLGTGSVTITYSKIETAPGKPTNVSLSKNNVGPSTNVTLNWSSGGMGSSSSVTYYIYGGPQTYTTTSTSYSVPSSATNGGTYAYYVRAKGSNGMWSENSSSVTLKTTWTNPSTPSSVGFKVDGSTTVITPVYIGTSSAPSLTLDWEDSTSGTNNPFKSYTVFLDGTSLKTGLTSSEYDLTSKTAGIYTVQAMGTHSHSSISSGAVLGVISTPAQPTITSNFTKVSSNPTFTWNSVAAVNNASLIYQVRYTVGETISSWIDNGTSTSYTLNLDNAQILENFSFTFSVRTRAKATNGGYTYSSITTTNTITRVASFIYPTTLWTQCYGVTSDGTALQTVNMYPYGYNYCKLGWNAVTSSTGNSITYTVNYKIGASDSWKPIASTTSTSAIINLSSIAEGSQIIFQLVANDGTITGSDTRTYTYTKLTKPVISNLSIVSVDKTTVQPKFIWGNGDSSNSSLDYEVYLGYNNKETLYRRGTYAYSDTKTWQEPLSINLANGASSTSNEMIQTLYNAVKGDVANDVLGLAKPAGYVKVVMYNSIFVDCRNSHTLNFNYDFSDIPQSPALSSFSIANGAKWVNPNTTFSYKFGAASWEDALGNTSNQIGGRIEYVITGNNKTITSFNANTAINDIVLTATNDIYLTYSLATKLVYADYTAIAEKTIEASTYIARWSSADNISLANVTKEKQKVSGELILPAYLCGSKQYPAENVSSVSYNIYNSNDSSNTSLWSGSLDFNSVANFAENITVPFELTSEVENLSLYGVAVFTNTSNDIITKTSSSYLLRGTGVPLAIRKGRIGINVDNSFNKENDASTNSALYVASNSDTAPVMEISASSGETDKDLLVYYKGDAEVGRVSSREGDAISISGLTQVDSSQSLMASDWSSDTYATYRINNNYITDTTIQELLPRPSNINQLKAYQKANLIGGTQGDGYCYIVCYGTKPTIDIPITLIIRGG